VDILNVEYKPLINTTAGRIDMCGLHFSGIIRTLDSRLIGLQGSVNSSYAAGKVPGVLIKFSARELVSNQLVPRKVHYGGIRIGKISTKAMAAVPGDDGMSLLLITDMLKSPDIIGDFASMFPIGALVSVSLDPTKSDYAFHLPPFADKDISTIKELADCNNEGMSTLIKEIEAEPEQ